MTQQMIDTGTDHLLAQLNEGVLTLTFNRPEARNALSGDLLQALGNQLSMRRLTPTFVAWWLPVVAMRFVPVAT